MQNIAESLKKQRDLIARESSEDLFSRHNSLLEVAIISLYNRLVNRLSADTEEFRSSGAVVALGPFGRALVGPKQSIPILFLTAETSIWEAGWSAEITRSMQDAGWTMDVTEATGAAALHRARDEFPFLLQLLDARYISGNRQLFEHLEHELTGYLEEQRDELLQRLLDAFRARQQRLSDPQSWLEPDLLQDPGSLADVEGIRLACRITSQICGLDDAIFQGYLVRQEVDFLQHAEKSYTRFLSALRNFSGQTAVTLGFETQELLANRLGYAARAGFLPVEAFMREVHELLHGVRCIAEEFWARLQESRWEQLAEQEESGEPLEEGLDVRAGKIRVQPDRYPATPGHLIHLFKLAAAINRPFSNATRHWLHHYRNVLETAAGDAMVRAELLELIRSDAPDLPNLRRLYNQGSLTALIPELAAVHGLVQHDAFHIYPVQEHHLRTLAELKRLFAGAYADSEPELTELARQIEDPTWLYVAGLLHDIGKSAESDHALHGGVMIPTIARRLGLHPEESDAVQFLVAQHLLLMDSASLRDLADEEMLAQCALIIQSPQQLDNLLLLSFADMMATGPKARQKWRNTPTLALHERVRHLLEKGEPSPQAIAERIGQIRTQVGQEVADLMDNGELNASLAQMAARYLLSMPPRSIAKHLRMEKQLQQSAEPLIWEVTESDGLFEITLLSWEMPGLLWRAAGILTLHDMNISSAQVFTKENEVVLLLFQCRLPEQAAGEAPDWEAVKMDMKRLLQGRISLEYRIAAHAAKRGYPQPPVRHLPSRVVIDNESSEIYTILEVYTVDQVGLLYRITWALWEMQVRIYVAKIATKVDQVADVFYIRTKDGDKVTDPLQIEEIQNALRFWLDGPEQASAKP